MWQGGGQRGSDRPSADPCLPGSSVDPAPASPVKQPQAPKRGAGPSATPPVVIDMTEEKKWPSSEYHWDMNEKKAVDAYLKANCGLECTWAANSMCFHDMRDLLYPSTFRACKHKDKCHHRHGRTATAGGGAFLDGSESQKDAIRALTPSFAARIASGTIRPFKIPKKKAGK